MYEITSTNKIIESRVKLILTNLANVAWVKVGLEASLQPNQYRAGNHSIFNFTLTTIINNNAFTPQEMLCEAWHTHPTLAANDPCCSSELSIAA